MHSVEEAVMYTAVTMDPASQTLALELPPNVCKSISVQATHSNIPCTTVHYWHRGKLYLALYSSRSCSNATGFQQ